MGQESPIEPWLAPDNRAACESPNRPASLRQNDENRWQRKPKALREGSSVPRSRNGRPEQSCSMGWAGRQENLRPKEKSFFLDSFYRTYQALAPQHDRLAQRCSVWTTNNEESHPVSFSDYRLRLLTFLRPVPSAENHQDQTRR